MKKYLRICYCITVCSIFSECVAQNMERNRANSRIYHSYASNEYAGWLEGINDLQQISRNSPGTAILLDLCIAKYGLVGYYLSLNSKKEAEALLEETLTLALNLEKSEPGLAEVHAVLGGLYGLKIALSPAKAVYLGMRSTRYLEKAIELNPNSPIAWIEMANSKFHAPPLFGGSMDLAAGYFAKAIALYDKVPANKKQGWHYLHALAWLGQAYEKNKQPSKAKAVYLKALSFEPQFTWVRDKLLPSLDNTGS